MSSWRVLLVRLFEVGRPALSAGGYLPVAVQIKAGWWAQPGGLPHCLHISLSSSTSCFHCCCFFCIPRLMSEPGFHCWLKTGLSLSTVKTAAVGLPRLHSVSRSDKYPESILSVFQRTPSNTEIIRTGLNRTRGTCLLSCTRGHSRRKPSVKQRAALSRHRICWCFDLVLPSLPDHEKRISLADEFYTTATQMNWAEVMTMLCYIYTQRFPFQFSLSDCKDSLFCFRWPGIPQ